MPTRGSLRPCLGRWGNTKATPVLPPVALVVFVLLVPEGHGREGGHVWEDEALGSSHLSQACSIVLNMEMSVFSTLPLMMVTTWSMFLALKISV